MNLTERIAYIRGLADGLKLDENRDEVKVIKAMIDLLEDMAYDVVEMEETSSATTRRIMRSPAPRVTRRPSLTKTR